jgi:probable HAF family extracellular repeat protein
MRRTILLPAIAIAFLWPLCAQAAIVYEVIDLGTLGGRDSRARAINEAGQMVGYAQDSKGMERATLFDPTGAGNKVDVNSLIDPDSGWMLTYAYDMNASGLIVGRGHNPQRERRAVLLVPEPGAFALLGCGVIMLRRRRTL